MHEPCRTQKTLETNPARRPARSKAVSSVHQAPFSGLQRSVGNREVQRFIEPSRSMRSPLGAGQSKEEQTHSHLHPEASGPLSAGGAPPSATIQRWGLDDVLDTAGDIVGIGSKIAGPANLLDKAGYLGTGTSGLLGSAGPLLGIAAPALALTSGISSLMDDDASTEDTVLGGLKTAGGAASLLGKGLLAAGGGMGSVGGGSLFGMSAGSALTGGSAGLGTAAGAGAALSSAGAVALSGAAGYGLGRMLDEGVGGLMNVTGAGAALDEMRGISRPEGQSGDYSLSGMGGDAMAAMDRTATGAMRSLGILDERKPAYTQTLGWKLAEILPSWMQ